jgi:hypothetical protein
MDEMDATAIYLDAKLSEFPQSSLLIAPVEFVDPIIQQIP